MATLKAEKNGVKYTFTGLKKEALKAGVDFSKRFKNLRSEDLYNLAHIAHYAGVYCETSVFFSRLKAA